MPITTDASFGINDLNSHRRIDACPVNECDEEPTQIGKLKICFKHGLEIHRSTYVYYNGDNAPEKKKARLRNFLSFRRDYVQTHILNNKHKAESHRLGSENSEDSLSWNIFAGLLHYERLHRVYNYITGETASHNNIELFLWGLKIDLNDDQHPNPWKPLSGVRNALEPRKEIRRFRTEPDIMILGPSHLVCIEAKFTSGNPIAINKYVAAGHKPKSKDALIERYIQRNKIWNPPLIKQLDVEEQEKVHSQLLRMLVFTSTIAQLVDRPNWIVANLVSNTQWRNRKNSREYDFNDPTHSIPTCVRSNFRFISWEDDIYKNILKNDSALDVLSKYMENKTANLKKAFDLTDCE